MNGNHDQTALARSSGAPERLGAVFGELALHRRAAVGELATGELRQLEAAGVEVANGWARIHDDVELLRPARIRAALAPAAAAWLACLDVHAQLASTNTLLLARARDTSVDGHVLAAEVQTAGRGRRGRDWQSPFGRNLAVSFGLAPPPTGHLGAFSLVAGLAVCAALADIGMSDVHLKWPNDVLFKGRKLAGVLIEIGAPPGCDAVVGIGVNVGGGAALAARVDQPIADVAESVPGPCRNALLAALINRLVEAKTRFARDGFAPFLARWERAHQHQNKTVRLTFPGNAADVTGEALGVAADGALRVATAQGERTFVSGEVSLRTDSCSRERG